MVLPGIQALFGFQTVAVFNQRFDALPAAAQYTHLLALGMVVIAIALIMAPAAWHRITGPQRVSERIVNLSSRMIFASLAPLAMGLALDMYVVVYTVSASAASAIAAAVLALGLLLTLWFALPMRRRYKGY